MDVPGIKWLDAWRKVCGQETDGYVMLTQVYNDGMIRLILMVMPTIIRGTSHLRELSADMKENLLRHPP